MAKQTWIETPEVEEGFTEQATMGELTGEWVTPEVGMVVRGQLERAFIFTSDNGTSAAYAGKGSVLLPDGSALMKGDGSGPLEEWLLSEKASFADAIRAQKMGTDIKLTFTAKEPLLIPDKKKPGQKKKSGKDIWRVQLLSKLNGKGETARNLLNRSAAEAAARAKFTADAAAAATAGGDAAPF